MLRHTGTVLLALGFAMLAGAVLILDPTAPDANIGAGILAIVGVPTGSIGLALIVAHVAFAIRVRHDPELPADPGATTNEASVP